VETNNREPLMKCRKSKDVTKTRGALLIWEEPGGNLLTVQVVAGMKAA
jgi:hypothetical protein